MRGPDRCNNRLQRLQRLHNVPSQGWSLDEYGKVSVFGVHKETHTLHIRR